MNINHCHFPNIGYTNFFFSDDELFPLKEEIQEIQKNNFDAPPMNHELAGNIEKEYKLTKSVKYIEKLLLPVVLSFDKEFSFLKDNFNILKKNDPLVLDGLWVNFQKKHEFNPNHTHSGIFSFVIWIKIPYTIENEKGMNSCKKSNMNCPGNFELLYMNSLGKISSELIPVDEKYENCGIFFPSDMNHAVYPFYTSDDYRISVSGNFKIDNT
jgi:hypothetical protein